MKNYHKRPNPNAAFPSAEQPILKLGTGTVGVSVAEARRIWTSKHFILGVFIAELGDEYEWECEGLRYHDLDYDIVLDWLFRCPHRYQRERLLRDYAENVLCHHPDVAAKAAAGKAP